MKGILHYGLFTVILGKIVNFESHHTPVMHCEHQLDYNSTMIYCEIFSFLS